MKKLICVVMLMFMLSTLAGCGATMESADNQSDVSMFVRIEVNTSIGYQIVYHKETKVMYAISNGGYNGGTFTVMLDADGKPMLYDNNI